MGEFSMLPADVSDRWALTVEADLGGRANLQWLVSAQGAPLVLRRYPAEPLGDVAYELSVLRCLDALGWPVPVPVDDPLEADGHIWCLFTRLPGAPPTVTDLEAEQRARGRLLAKLHADTATLVDLGQRCGWRRAEAVVTDAELDSQLGEFQRLFPRQARVLQWHAHRARECFEELDLEDRQLIVLHGDFVARNLLYQDGKLTGIVDFEGTHLNHRASEFALAWQGKYDDVIRGYEEVRPLDELDGALLAPTLWSWILLGVANDIRRMTSGIIAPHGFDWQVGRLLRRSPLMGREAAPYPGE
ncbi:phosphotransferase enzyme family protein [Actinopolymorpha alba]|uniref:phosphotransferase enzyme family protein n=1 Tax=Actinopolymorpha alba TaxID=533267 RepID=UPI000380C586|nr:phosphotransferase [Actinopolymorpha alba]